MQLASSDVSAFKYQSVLGFGSIAGFTHADLSVLYIHSDIEWSYYIVDIISLPFPVFCSLEADTLHHSGLSSHRSGPSASDRQLAHPQQ